MSFLNTIYRTMLSLRKTCKAAGAVFLAVVMSFLLVACSRDKGPTTIPGSAILPVASKSAQPSGADIDPNQIRLTGVFTFIDRNAGKMHYMDVDDGMEYEVAFDGGTNIQNKYDMIITTGKMSLGTIYDVVCNKKGMAVSISESKTAWKISGISNFSVDEREQVASLNTKTYKYSRSAILLSDGRRIQPSEIMKQDVVTACGIDKTLYSVNVDKGHGYLKLTGVDNFVGGFVDIGRAIVDVISKDMLITVPEGEYKVSVQNTARTLSGSKSVRIERDRDVTLDFSEYIPEPVKNGTVEFSVTPAGAVMYIDGTQVSYDEPVTLDYGRHTVVLRANNYLAYEEVFFVKQSYEKKIIDMTMSRSNQAVQNTKPPATTSSTAPRQTQSQASTASANKGTSALTTIKDLTDGYSINIKEPEGAAVYVNNYYVGMAPVTIEKKAGTMVIALTMAGRRTKSYSLSIPNKAGDINYSFPALELSSPDSDPDIHPESSRLETEPAA